MRSLGLELFILIPLQGHLHLVLTRFIVVDGLKCERELLDRREDPGDDDLRGNELTHGELINGNEVAAECEEDYLHEHHEGPDEEGVPSDEVEVIVSGTEEAHHVGILHLFVVIDQVEDLVLLRRLTDGGLECVVGGSVDEIDRGPDEHRKNDEHRMEHEDRREAEEDHEAELDDVSVGL